MVMFDRPQPQNLLNIKFLLNIKLLSPLRSALLAMLLLPAAVAPPRRRPARAPSPTPPLQNGRGRAGATTSSGPRPWSRGWSTPGGWPWLPDGFRADHRSVPGALRPRAAMGARSKADFRVPRGAGPGGKGGCWIVAVDADFERNRFHLSEATRQARGGGQRHPGARARFNGPVS